ncbi:hypothetical protein CEXT_620641 [Caerostris extrusa]|uniref:Uncharacterized protein n=1 Tax=Caerostris extrusa TaxID=172846 RepID=A0AAV4P631_CAEEX|nr:hypothetical protein CEXT_620641 [Caerostris extrusa]
MGIVKLYNKIVSLRRNVAECKPYRHPSLFQIREKCAGSRSPVVRQGSVEIAIIAVLTEEWFSSHINTLRIRQQQCNHCASDLRANGLHDTQRPGSFMSGRNSKKLFFIFS